MTFGGIEGLTDCIDMSSITATMSPKTMTAMRLDNALLAVMRKVKATEGIPLTTQIEMAVREWLTKRGTIKKTGRKRVTARKRP